MVSGWGKRCYVCWSCAVIAMLMIKAMIQSTWKRGCKIRWYHLEIGSLRDKVCYCWNTTKSGSSINTLWSLTSVNTSFEEPLPWFNNKIPSYQYRKSHCGDKTILRPSYLHNGISYTDKTTALYWIWTLLVMRIPTTHWLADPCLNKIAEMLQTTF